MTATRVIEMEDPAAAIDSSGVPFTIERSPLDFASEAGPKDQGTMTPEVPLPEDMPTTRGAPEASQTESVVVTSPLVITESRKRSSDRVDTNASPKVLRRDHDDPRPTGSNRGGKSLAAIELGLGSTRPTPVQPSGPVDASDPDPLSFANPESSQGTAAVGDLKSQNTSYASMVGSPESIYRPEWGIVNGSMLDTPEACQDLVDHVAPPGGDGVTATTEVRTGSKTAEEIRGDVTTTLSVWLASGAPLVVGTSSGSGTSWVTVPWSFGPASLAKSKGDLSIVEGTPDESMAAARSSISITRVAVMPSGPVDASDPDPLSFANPESHPPVDVAQSSQGTAAAGDLKSQNTSYASMVGSPESIYRPEWGIVNGSMLDTPEACQDLVDHVAPPGGDGVTAATKVATLQEQVRGEEKLKAAFEEFKRYEDSRVEQHCTEMDARLDALSIDFDEELYPHMLTAIAGRRWRIGHGGALPDTEDDAPQWVCDLRPSSSQLTIPVYPEVRDPMKPWACKEEMLLADAIAANVSRAEKKKKCRIGLALLLADAATQTEPDEVTLGNL
nr:hypothetical protein [Tanacetum cinerariifolium]